MDCLRRLAWASLLAAATWGTAPALAQRQVELDPVPARPGTSALSPDWQHGVFMEVFVRAYQDSDGDGIGDLRGLISRLDYLRDLGVTGLWLMPVMPSLDQDHGYATHHYRDIEPQYGSLADFDNLLAQAHARGIGVIMDYGLNHSAATHPAFERSVVKGRYRDWYLWSDEQPPASSLYGRDPWVLTDNGSYFASYWSQMPDFNLRNPAVLAWHQDNLRFWLNRGLDGVRIESAANLIKNGPDQYEAQPENEAILRDLRQLVAAYPNRYLVCEAAAAPLRYASAEVCGASFAFGHNFNVIGAAGGDEAALADAAAYFVSAPPTMATFASSHDGFAGDRLWDQLDGDANAVRLAAATYLLLPGTPFIYYGEEVGMSAGSGLADDARLRTPMSWNSEPLGAGFSRTQPFRTLASNAGLNNVAVQRNEPGSLWRFYQALIALRKSSPALMQGSYVAPKADGLVFTFERVLGAQRLLVAINYGLSAAVARPDGLSAGAQLQRRWPDGAAGDLADPVIGMAARTIAGAAVADAKGQLPINLPPQSIAVFELTAKP
ncbi:MAG: alpha-amylase family glycosyl hydrolase [Leptothrix sp. (in: b-proteobacteria)]